MAKTYYTPQPLSPTGFAKVDGNPVTIPAGTPMGLLLALTYAYNIIINSGSGTAYAIPALNKTAWAKEVA